MDGWRTATRFRLPSAADVRGGASQHNRLWPAAHKKDAKMDHGGAFGVIGVKSGLYRDAPCSMVADRATECSNTSPWPGSKKH